MKEWWVGVCEILSPCKVPSSKEVVPLGQYCLVEFTIHASSKAFNHAIEQGGLGEWSTNLIPWLLVASYCDD